MKLGLEVGLDPGHIVLDEDPASLPKRGTDPPIFGPFPFHGKIAVWIKMPLAVEVRLGPGDFVLDGHRAPLKKGVQPPFQFSAHVYCGQMAGWIRMPLGMEVGLGTGDFVLYGSQLSPLKNKGTAPYPIFGPCILWPNGWMD